jgi:hypothetical protein
MSNRSKKNRQEVKRAYRWGINACIDGHVVLQLFDQRGNAFAEAHGLDPHHLASTLLSMASYLASAPNDAQVP